METKICKKCGRELPLSEFAIHKVMKDGHLNVCKECHSEQYKQWALKNRERRAEYKKQYSQEHKEERKEYDKQHRSEINERQRKWRSENKDKCKKYSEASKERLREYYQENKKEKWQDVAKTPIGRARRLLGGYNREDMIHGRGKGDLTPQWIVDNIFTKPCAHCGKTGWDVIGCNRLDNSKPHTKDNVEPCCKEHNDMLAAKDRMIPVLQYSLDDVLIKEWESATAAGKELGISQSKISECCRNCYLREGNNVFKDFIWRYA